MFPQNHSKITIMARQVRLVLVDLAPVLQDSRIVLRRPIADPPEAQANPPGKRSATKDERPEP